MNKMIFDDIDLSIKDLIDGYSDNQENGVFGYKGKLNIRPAYQLPDISHKRDIKCLCILSMSIYHNCDIIKS